MRPQDVINIARLHLDAIVRLGEVVPQADAVAESDWSPEHDAELDRIMREIDEEKNKEEENPEEGSEEGDEEDYEGSEGEPD